MLPIQSSLLVALSVWLSLDASHADPCNDRHHRQPSAGKAADVPSPSLESLLAGSVSSFDVWATSARDLVAQLPPGLRRQAVTRLLQRLEKPGQILALIQVLPAEVGVAEGIQDYLATTTRLPSPSDAQKELIANSPAVRDKADFRFPDTLGFTPVHNLPELTTLIRNRFYVTRGSSGQQARQQLLGLIVQGAYERAGFTLMSPITGRGKATIETDAPALADAIEESLASGSLRSAGALERQLFVQQWSIQSGQDLIHRIRVDAESVAKQDGAFWPLATEIHNFPDHQTLRKTREFRAKRRTSLTPEQRELLARLIRDIEVFLGLRAPDASAGTPVNDASHPHTDRIRADLGHRQQSLADAAKAVSAGSPSRSPEEWTALAEELLLQTAKDFEVEAATIAVFVDASKRLRDAPLGRAEKARLLEQLYSSFIQLVETRLRDRFGLLDDALFGRFRGAGSPPPRFIDSTLRSSHALLLARWVSLLATRSTLTLDGRGFARSAIAENPGVTEGILRYGKNPLELGPDEIGLFDELPPDSGPLAGFVSFSAGNSLSHLQLLARSLGLPGAVVLPEARPALLGLNGRRVRLTVRRDGSVSIEPVAVASTSSRSAVAVAPPVPDFSISKPLTLEQFAQAGYPRVAGSKSVGVAKLSLDPELTDPVGSGVILPFGFWRRYADAIGLKPLLEVLGRTDPARRLVVASLLQQIRARIRGSSLPASLLHEALVSTRDLIDGSGSAGAFFRCDTLHEDHDDFNGAGLHTSMPHVLPTAEQVDQAIRKVYASVFGDHAVGWKIRAYGGATVPITDPAVLILPTVPAEFSGVLVTGKTPVLSAAPGISGVVSGGGNVDEYLLHPSGANYRRRVRSRDSGQALAPGGGLQSIPLSGSLTEAEIQAFRGVQARVERKFGRPAQGWDIEWALVRAPGGGFTIRILQIRSAPATEH